MIDGVSIDINEVRCDCGYFMLELPTGEYECGDCGKKKNTYQSDINRRVHCRQCGNNMERHQMRDGDGIENEHWECINCGFKSETYFIEVKYWEQVLGCRRDAMMNSLTTLYTRPLLQGRNFVERWLEDKISAWVQVTWEDAVREYNIEHHCDKSWDLFHEHFKLKIKLTPIPDELRRKANGTVNPI